MHLEKFPYVHPIPNFWGVEPGDEASLIRGLAGLLDTICEGHVLSQTLESERSIPVQSCSACGRPAESLFFTG